MSGQKPSRLEQHLGIQVAELVLGLKGDQEVAHRIEVEHDGVVQLGVGEVQVQPGEVLGQGCALFGLEVVDVLLSGEEFVVDR